MLNCRFTHFDPTDGLLSARLGTLFFEPLYRARQLLTNRTNDDIRAIGRLLEEAWRSPSFKTLRPTEGPAPSMKVKLESGEIVGAWPTPDEAAVLEANIEHVDLRGIGAPRQLQHYELFAVLALSYIEQACAEEHRLADETAPDWLKPTDTVVIEHVQHYAYTSLRAASLGARFHAEHKKRITTASRGGEVRHKQSQLLKAKVLALYDERFRGTI